MKLPGRCIKVHCANRERIATLHAPKAVPSGCREGPDLHKKAGPLAAVNVAAALERRQALVRGSREDEQLGRPSLLRAAAQKGRSASPPAQKERAGRPRPKKTGSGERRRAKSQKEDLITVGFEPTPSRTSALSWRLRPLGQVTSHDRCTSGSFASMRRPPPTEAPAGFGSV